MDKKQVTVIGPGRMGLGIALAVALKGFKVTSSMERTEWPEITKRFLGTRKRRSIPM